MRTSYDYNVPSESRLFILVRHQASVIATNSRKFDLPPPYDTPSGLECSFHGQKAVFALRKETVEYEGDMDLSYITRHP